MFSRRSMMVALAFGGCLLFSAPAMAAGRGAVGSFTTPTVSETVKFVAVKRVVRWNGYQGNMVISGRTYPGIMFGLRDGSGRVAFVWYYVSDYAQAGQAIQHHGHAGTISKCTVCHQKQPNEPFFHKIEVITGWTLA